MALRSDGSISNSTLSDLMHPSPDPSLTQLEPYQSDSFRHVRARMQSLSPPPATSPATARNELCLPSNAAESSSEHQHHMHGHSSPTPSPPTTESSCDFISQTPRTEASDSSASSSTDEGSSINHSPASCKVSYVHHSGLLRPTLANKRVLSDGDVVKPRANKRRCIALTSALRKRSLHLSSASSDNVMQSTPTIASDASSWRQARKQQRERQLAKRTKALAGSTAKPKGSTTTTPQNSIGKHYVLPELRLLSATRTAPIGWAQFGDRRAFAPQLVEVYDERDAKQAPERQRFWPIIDRQLDYTGARLLSLSNASQHGRVRVAFGDRKRPSPLPTCEPVSPKSGFPPAPANGHHSLLERSMPAYSHAVASSDEELSPLTPDAPPGAFKRPSVTISRHARDNVANESQRQATITISPAATLSAVIDFTRAQHQQRTQASQSKSQAAPRNDYGQPVHSPPTPPAVIATRKQLAANALPCIAPRPLASNKGGRDYFGHWETYLCNYGKESTF